MFDEILTIINVIRTIVYFTLYYSFKTGQCLVDVLHFIFKTGLTILKNLGDIFIIINDSFTIFCQDIIQVLELLIEVVGHLWETIGAGVSTSICNLNIIFIKICSALFKTFDIFENAVFFVYELIITICILIKDMIVLFGAGVWLTVTFIPYSLMILIKSFPHLIKDIISAFCNELVMQIKYLKDCIKNIFHFVTDVPIESMIGLIIAACLIYIVTQFYVTLYQNARQIYFNILNRFYRSLFVQPIHVRQNNRVANYVRSPTVRRRIRRNYEPSPESKTNEVDERFCVICQDRVKCILVLPCRHVCMCMECSCTLQMYNNNCPICRNDIESTMKIFV